MISGSYTRLGLGGSGWVGSLIVSGVGWITSGSGNCLFSGWLGHSLYSSSHAIAKRSSCCMVTSVSCWNSLGGTVMSGSLWLLAKGRSLILCKICVKLVWSLRKDSCCWVGF